MPGMSHGYKKPDRSRPAPKKGPPLGLVIALAVAGGVVIGSAGTYFLVKRQQSASAAAAGTTQMQAITTAPQQQFTPAPQPPGEVPPGKVWSVEHGHWHDAAPVTIATPAPGPAPATVTPAATPAPVTVAPAATPPPTPAAAPAEKKE